MLVNVYNLLNTEVPIETIDTYTLEDVCNHMNKQYGYDWGRTYILKMDDINLEQVVKKHGIVKAMEIITKMLVELSENIKTLKKEMKELNYDTMY